MKLENNCCARQKTLFYVKILIHIKLCEDR
jgi:hypothetical protein